MLDESDGGLARPLRVSKSAIPQGKKVIEVRFTTSAVA